MINIINFVHKNIHLLTPEHLKIFANENNISYTEEEIEIIYHLIQNHYQELINGDITCLENEKQNISPSLYQTLLDLYQKYQKKLRIN